MNLQDTMLETGRKAREASREMMCASDSQKSMALRAMADGLVSQRDHIKSANAIDL